MRFFTELARMLGLSNRQPGAPKKAAPKQRAIVSKKPGGPISRQCRSAICAECLRQEIYFKRRHTRLVDLPACKCGGRLRRPGWRFRQQLIRERRLGIRSN